MINFVQDFACGSVSGVGSCLAGYILDTLKVRMQMQPQLQMFATLNEIVRAEGFLHLFKGIYYPLLTIPLINAVTFSSYEFYKNIRGKVQLSLIDGMENGAFAGLIVTAVVTPSELIKCTMQMDKTIKYKTSRLCFEHILKTQGISGLFKGMIPTAAREIPSYSIQFATYELLKEKFTSEEKKHLLISEALLVGPIAAINSQMLSYPQDVIKTKIQVEPAGTYPLNKFINDGGIINCAKSIYKKHGLKGFAIGIKPCLIRATLADGLAIVLYQKCQQKFGSIVSSKF